MSKPKTQIVKKDFDIEALVESNSAPGASYTVKITGTRNTEEASCTCKAFEFGGGQDCKHITHVRETIGL